MGQVTVHHKELSESGRWEQMPFYEQMANIGSEINRACKWREKQKPEMMQKAFERGLELLDFTIENAHGPRLRELLRAREAMCDFFVGNNIYNSTPEQLTRYFDSFAFALKSRQK